MSRLFCVTTQNTSVLSWSQLWRRAKHLSSNLLTLKSLFFHICVEVVEELCEDLATPGPRSRGMLHVVGGRRLPMKCHLYPSLSSPGYWKHVWVLVKNFWDQLMLPFYLDHCQFALLPTWIEYCSKPLIQSVNREARIQPFMQFPSDVVFGLWYLLWP
jgi:hypothetical protein